MRKIRLFHGRVRAETPYFLGAKLLKYLRSCTPSSEACEQGVEWGAQDRECA